jgi:phage terminase large subunit GpA-like protein
MSALRLEADAADLAASALQAMAPPPDITVAEWAEQHRIIPLGNAEPGQWSNDRAPYLTEIMEAATDIGLNTIVIVGAAQSGKTAAGENVVGHASCLDPCTVLWACPNDASAEAASSRFDAMIAATPEMTSRFGARSARSVVNNVGLKSFTGGKLIFASAGSPTSLASHPARLVIGDEIDRWPVSLRKEGDPVALIKARTTTFARGKAIYLSSPTQEGASRIEALAAEGDMREWQWRCDCGAEFVPDWEAVEWPPGEPERARYLTACCGTELDDAARWRAMARGRWVPTRQGQPGVRSYRIRGLHSPWLRMSLLASEYEQARGNPRKMAPFFNLRLGLPYLHDQGEGVDAETVKALAEDYPDTRVPDGAALVVASIDVQGGWCAVMIAAVGDADELWVLQWHQVDGDVKDPETRRKVEELLSQKFRVRSGAVLEIEAIAVDSGYETQTVLEWSQRHRAAGRRFLATKGAHGWRRGLWERGGDVARSMAAFFLVGIDQGKAQVLAGLAMADPGPGKVHTPRRFEQHSPHFWQWATAEELHVSETAGGTKKEWRLKRSERRNEVLDCLVLCLAISHSRDFQIPQRLERLHRTGNVKAPPPDMAALAARIAAASA